LGKDIKITIDEPPTPVLAASIKENEVNDVLGKKDHSLRNTF
jgi:hypothetical protein